MIDTAISTEANTVHSVSILLCLIKNLKMPKNIVSWSAIREATYNRIL